MTETTDDLLAKATVRIPKELYNDVQEHLDYGQPSKLFTRVYEAVNSKILEGKFGEVIDFMYKGTAITLTGNIANEKE